MSYPMTDPDVMRDDAIKEYLDSMSLDTGHQIAGFQKLCDTLETIGAIRELRRLNARPYPVLSVAGERLEAMQNAI